MKNSKKKSEDFGGNWKYTEDVSTSVGSDDDAGVGGAAGSMD